MKEFSQAKTDTLNPVHSIVERISPMLKSWHSYSAFLSETEMERVSERHIVVENPRESGSPKP